MKINLDLAKKNKVEKLKISENQAAWLLPENNNFRKMIAYSYNNSITWVHPEYRHGKNRKK